MAGGRLDQKGSRLTQLSTTFVKVNVMLDNTGSIDH